MRLKDLCAFCFPGGVKARMLERTPSLSDLNSLVYGQEHLGRDDLAFVFSLKAAENGTMYGVCLQVPEIVQRPPAILANSSPLSQPSLGGSRFLVSAPRCYCVLTRLPFFELHFEMLNSSLKSMDEDYDSFSSQESDCSGDFMTMEWAKENKNDLLQIICAYGVMPIPERGSEMIFQPHEHLQSIRYLRPSFSDLLSVASSLDTNGHDPIKSAEVNARLAAAEEALELSVWTTATLCRALSLDSILSLLTGVLLEKQVIVVCPNLGILSAVVLSIVPLISPFEWQSLLLRILPAKMIDFLDAPVPYIVGRQNKPEEFKMKTSNLVHVDVGNNQMCFLPMLPKRKELYSELRPIHAVLASQCGEAERYPVYKCNEVQAEAAAQFLDVMKRYMESLCADFRSYSITSVQSNNDRVSLLLKGSFIDSFPGRDRYFIKLFVDTQMFSALSDSRLTMYEHEKP